MDLPSDIFWTRLDWVFCEKKINNAQDMAYYRLLANNEFHLWLPKLISIIS